MMSSNERKRIKAQVEFTRSGWRQLARLNRSLGARLIRAFVLCHELSAYLAGHEASGVHLDTECQEVRYTIRPWLVRIEQSINRALFSDAEKAGSPGGRRFFVQFNIDGLMRGDYKSRMEGYAIARQNGWMSANDIRELENLNPLSEEEGGNAYLINGNMIPINLAGLGVLMGLQIAAMGNEETPEESPPPKETDKKKE